MRNGKGDPKAADQRPSSTKDMKSFALWERTGAQSDPEYRKTIPITNPKTNIVTAFAGEKV